MELRVLNTTPEKILELYEFFRTRFPFASPELSGVIQNAKHGISIEIIPYVFERSREQEKYYRKWAGEFAKFCGMTPDELHDEMLCICFGSEDVATKFGHIRRPLKRSKGTNRVSYSDLIETLIRTAAEMGFDVPPPRRDP